MLAHESLLSPLLINTVGHTAGVLLLGLVIIFLLRHGRAHGLHQIKLSLVAAALAFTWNIGSLIVIASAKPNALLAGLVATLSFSVLSLLPAVLLQITLQGKQTWTVWSGYLISAFAAILHPIEIFSTNSRLHQLALLLIVVGFGFLIILVFLLRKQQGQNSWKKPNDWISLACLLLFTTSFLHFGYGHISSAGAAEITWHHLGIPVVLIVLLQDYRFLLFDTFVRFLVNSWLAAAYVATLLAVNQRFHFFQLIQFNSFLQGISLVGLCLSLVLFASLRNVVQIWVSGALFRRQSIEQSIQTISQLSSSSKSEEEVLDRGAKCLANHLETEHFVLFKDISAKLVSARPSILFLEQNAPEITHAQFRPEAQIPLRFSSGDTRFLVLGSRRGGRRYLSEDLDDMRRLGSAIVEQIERFRADELRRLANEAELRALQAQINPHFLFNALNTLYGTIDRQSHAARQLVLNLADVFRYFLQGNQTMIPLSEELRIVRAYLAIEEARLGDRLESTFLVSDSVRGCLIPILSVQPLVENAVKHGIAPKPGTARVTVKAEPADGGVRITVEDTGVGFQRSKEIVRDGTGLGLENVRKRLKLCYGSASEFAIESNAEKTTVAFLVPDQAQSRRIPA